VAFRAKAMHLAGGIFRAAIGTLEMSHKGHARLKRNSPSRVNHGLNVLPTSGCVRQSPAHGTENSHGIHWRGFDGL
jgi:hypothetical protein